MDNISSYQSLFPNCSCKVTTHKHSGIQEFQVLTTRGPGDVKIVLVAETKNYTGKILYYEKGKPGPLQYHKLRDETFHLFSGIAMISYVDIHGRLCGKVMHRGQSFHISSGVVHQVESLSDEAVFIEISTPGVYDSVRVEEEYNTKKVWEDK